MYEKVARTIQKFGLFDGADLIVIGVSGGADSLCMLDCLAHLEYKLLVAHLDHGLRPESSGEAQFVEEVSGAYRAEFTKRTLDEGQLAARGGSLEEAARLARYNFLADVARERDASWVAVGHTADDQVETVLMHFLRGAGADGLRGMHPRTRISDWVGIHADPHLTLARPLIEGTRADTEAHCRRVGLTPIHDPSNQDLTYYRNRIRHELLPLLETYNPGIRQVILHLADVMREQADFNQVGVERIWPEVIQEIAEGSSLIRRAHFQKLHTFLQMALIRQAMIRLSPEVRDISHEATLRAVAWLNDPQGRLALPGGISLEMFGEDALLRLADAPLKLAVYPQMDEDAVLKLPHPGELDLAAGWRISARHDYLVEQTSKPWKVANGDQLAFFPAAGFPDELIVRTRRSGDRIMLPSVQGTTKISDLMINRKIPAQTRDRWPLVTTGDSILWVPGIHRSAEMMVDEQTSEVVVLELHQPEEENHVEATL